MIKHNKRLFNFLKHFIKNHFKKNFIVEKIYGTPHKFLDTAAPVVYYR